MTPICGEVLFTDGIPTAACTIEWGTEHSHSHYSAADAIAAGIARSLAEADTLYCNDPHHGSPCRFSCTACKADCDGGAFVAEALPSYYPEG